MNEYQALSEQFQYFPYYDTKQRDGWLLNYVITRDPDSAVFVTLYLVDDSGSNFSISLPYYNSILLEILEENMDIVEDFLSRKFEGAIKSFEIVNRIDPNQHNHLNLPPKKYLKLCCTNEIKFNQIIYELRSIINSNKIDNNDIDIYHYNQGNPIKQDATKYIIDIFEFDVPMEVNVATFFNIRCGLWYSIQYDGEQYTLNLLDKLGFPLLRVLAYDIETTKTPLKFPNAEFDEVMMISLQRNDIGELIVNRNIVSKDIQDFDYSPKNDVHVEFNIYNESNEEALLNRFVDIIVDYKPHLITTYNGSQFDFPFVENRLKKYGVSFSEMTSIHLKNDYYTSPFIIHLDCYKWVKRDSYLPMNSQGLKAATRAKLGYHPEEIDPEVMVEFASKYPHRLACYSVSDAVATYLLYIKYVQTHIFSVCSIIPLPPVQVLCKGSGTLCEALLYAEAKNYTLLIPNKPKTNELQYYNGHIIDTLSYIGGHVESCKAGIFRSDIVQNFLVNKDSIEEIIGKLDFILGGLNLGDDYEETKLAIVNKLRNCSGELFEEGLIYHLDVEAMYPNIILTNRLQPISIVDEGTCIRCDYNGESNNCKRKMGWVSKADYYLANQTEIKMIKSQLDKETFFRWQGSVSEKVPYAQLSQEKQKQILIERVQEFSRKMYSRIRKSEVIDKELVVCQREIPFYVETVRKFRDQRYKYKKLYKDAIKRTVSNPKDEENSKDVEIYGGIQVAYKCILNSFYGYVMRTGSRWFSLEMAAAVCNEGGLIIKEAKKFLQNFSIPLELDTDGIWVFIPKSFPSEVEVCGRKLPLLQLFLNFFVCKKFTNHNHQTKVGDAYEIQPANSINFEIDGPYKTMVIPSSVEENKLLKKRYAVFDFEDKIVELKGFELKRRGELNIIKKIQEDLFTHFNDGNSLEECYRSLSAVCEYWIDIVRMEGAGLDDDTVFDLFSESRNMSKSIDDYKSKKSNILSTANKLAEFLGKDILGDKLKCEFIVSKYPINAPVADRVLPCLIFKSTEKQKYLKKWLSTSDTDLKKIIDWNYYSRRIEAVLLRMIIIPACLQGIQNPLPMVQKPDWIDKEDQHDKLNFKTISDIEDVGYGAEKNKPKRNKMCISIRQSTMKEYFKYAAPRWYEFYNRRLLGYLDCLKIEIQDEKTYLTKLFDGRVEKNILIKKIFLRNESPILSESSNTGFSKEKLVDVDPCSSSSVINVSDASENMLKFILNILGGNIKSYNILEKYVMNEKKKFSTVSLDVYNDNLNVCLDLMRKNGYSSMVYNLVDPMLQLISENKSELGDTPFVVVSSFDYDKKPIFVILNDISTFISESKYDGITTMSLNSFKDRFLCKRDEIIIINRLDGNFGAIDKTFQDYHKIYVKCKITKELGSFEEVKNKQIKNNLNFKNKATEMRQICELWNIPLLNVNESILDILYYDMLTKGNVACNEVKSNFIPRLFTNEYHKETYTTTKVIQFECCLSYIISIIEYRSLLTDSLYDRHTYEDFKILRDLVKDIALKASKGITAAQTLAHGIVRWIFKDSKLITTELRDLILVLHNRFMSEFIKELRELQCKILMVSGNIIMIDTQKKDVSGCDAFFDYINQKITQLSLFKLLKMKRLKTFDNMALLSANKYFYSTNNRFYSFSDYLVPSLFLKKYFNEKTWSNNDAYSIIRKINKNSAKIVVDLVNLKYSSLGFENNCLKLLKINSFPENNFWYPSTLVVLCDNCNFENRMYTKCIRCYAPLDRNEIENVCIEYLEYLKYNDNTSTRKICVKCFQIKEKVDTCVCGGRVLSKNTYNEILKLTEFVKTEKFNKIASEIIGHDNLNNN